MRTGTRVTSAWRSPVIATVLRFQQREERGWFVDWDDGLRNDWCPERVLVEVAVVDRRSWLTAIVALVASTIGHRVATDAPNGYWHRTLTYEVLPGGSVRWTGESGERFVRFYLAPIDGEEAPCQ